MGFYLRLVGFGTSSSYYPMCMTEGTWVSKVFRLDRHVGIEGNPNKPNSTVGLPVEGFALMDRIVF